MRNDEVYSIDIVSNYNNLRDSDWLGCIRPPDQGIMS